MRQAFALLLEMERFELRSKLDGDPALRSPRDGRILQQFQRSQRFVKLRRQLVAWRNGRGKQVEYLVFHAAVGLFRPHFNARIQAAWKLQCQSLAHRLLSATMV